MPKDDLWDIIQAERRKRDGTETPTRVQPKRKSAPPQKKPPK